MHNRCLFFLLVLLVARLPVRAQVNDCPVNEATYVPMLMPTKEDTANMIRFFKSRPYADMTETPHYMNIPIVRGWVDTSVFDKEHYCKFDSLETSIKYAMIISPLIIEGDVIGAIPPYNEDLVFHTTILIRVNKIIKSQYNIRKGDTIYAKTMWYRFIKNHDTAKYEYPLPLDGLQSTLGNKPLFLDKYHYMYNLYINSHPTADKYCPYTFCIHTTTLSMMESYKNGKFNEAIIRSFLKL